MKREFAVLNNIAHVSYDNWFDLYGVMGRIPKRLEDAAASLKGLIEIGKVLRDPESGGRYFGAFSKIPLAEVIYSLDSNMVASINGLTYDSSIFLRLFDDITARSKFIIIPPSDEFVDGFKNMSHHMFETYRALSSVCPSHKSPKEAFAGARYSLFLSKYTDVDKTKVNKIFNDSFGRFERN